ncbi:MAG TPA: hypothetical protein PKN95_04835 [Verrucomicrobiota bacterium]|nr:hypothetical protein [Verrucomicrobiota bacterium]HNT15087.1 hypothetical protein [Verrucomicrobiota bacterium]
MTTAAPRNGLLCGGCAALLLGMSLGLTGCVTPPRTGLQEARPDFPPEALITQRGVLTVFGGRQFPLNGYAALSAERGLRLVVTENFGGVLADVLLATDGKTYVMRSSPALQPRWIERYLAADARWLFGLDRHPCPGEVLGPDRYRIKRRWYRLEVQTVSVVPGPQPPESFHPPAPPAR